MNNHFLSRAVQLFVGVVVLLTMSACATSTVVVGQSLDSDDRDISGIDNILVILKVNVESVNKGEYFRLDDVWATNNTTQVSYRFPLFSNMFMLTGNVPHDIDGNRLSQTIFLDLPAGNYSFDKLDLVTLQEYLDDSPDNDYIHQPYPKVTIEVTDGSPLYFGELNLRLIGVEQIGSEFRANVRLIPRSPSADGVDSLKDKYPALAGLDIRAGNMRQ